jgi:hypothetical protein
MEPMTNEKQKTAVQVAPERSVWARIAERHGMEVARCREVIMNTVMPRREGKLIASEADMAAALLIADRYELDVFTKEIHFTPGKGGGILSIVGVDGWVTLANRQHDYRGWSYRDIEDTGGKLLAVEVTIHFRGGREPQVIREWLVECKRPTEPWRNMERRMLRNRALCQAIRLAFGVGGILLEDEAADLIAPVTGTTVSSRPLPTPANLTQRIAERGAEIAGVSMPVELASAPVNAEPFDQYTAEQNAELDRQLARESGEES